MIHLQDKTVALLRLKVSQSLKIPLISSNLTPVIVMKSHITSAITHFSLLSVGDEYCTNSFADFPRAKHNLNDHQVYFLSLQKINKYRLLLSYTVLSPCRSICVTFWKIVCLCLYRIHKKQAKPQYMQFQPLTLQKGKLKPAMLPCIEYGGG